MLRATRPAARDSAVRTCYKKHRLQILCTVVICSNKSACLGRQEDPILLRRFRRKKKTSPLDRCWAMPNVLVEFMTHLPKTSQALPAKSLRWLTRRVFFVLFYFVFCRRAYWLTRTPTLRSGRPEIARGWSHLSTVGDFGVTAVFEAFASWRVLWSIAAVYRCPRRLFVFASVDSWSVLNV